MALDTRSKRASALAAFRPWLIALPLPDGVLDQGDRQHIAYSYSGILAGAAVVVVPPEVWPAIAATIIGAASWPMFSPGAGGSSWPVVTPGSGGATWPVITDL